ERGLRIVFRLEYGIACDRNRGWVFHAPSQQSSVIGIAVRYLARPLIGSGTGFNRKTRLHVVVVNLECRYSCPAKPDTRGELNKYQLMRRVAFAPAHRQGFPRC